MAESPTSNKLSSQEMADLIFQQYGIDKSDVKDRESFLSTWNSQAYLQDFYAKVQDPAMRLILIFLPNVVARLPIGGRLLDIGSGPTIHVACCFRKTKDEIYLSDYLPQNREELVDWVRGRGRFDWSTVFRMIAVQEGDVNGMKTMEMETRRKVRGILSCDIFRPTVIAKWNRIQAGFDIVSTIFCVEYACKTEEEYRSAIFNLGTLIRPGGHFIMGGIMEETWCGFGGVMYSCFYLTEKVLMESLEAAGIDTKNDLLYYHVNGIFLICGKKTPRP